MARTRKLLEALGEVEPRKFKRLSDYKKPTLTFQMMNPDFGVSIDDIVAQPITVPTTLLFHMPPMQYTEASFLSIPADPVMSQAAANMAVQMQNLIDEKILELMLEELKQQEAIDGPNKGC